jgi:peptidoglycan hydrolase-like protein with peptidoglycan-binding domain
MSKPPTSPAHYCGEKNTCENTGMRVAAVFFASVVLFAPSLSGAATVEELRAQVEALLLRIGEIQAQRGIGVAPVTPPVPLGPPECPILGRALKRGSSGPDVAALQAYLATDPNIYPEGTVSGYFGGLTEKAVQRWQASREIVSGGDAASTGFGVVGPRTAAAIVGECADLSLQGGGAIDVGGILSISPGGPTVPLTVMVNATVNTPQSCAASTYTLDYGDSTFPARIDVPANTCARINQLFSHQYSRGGVYTITLSSGTQKTVAIIELAQPVEAIPLPTENDEWIIASVAPAFGGDPFTVGITFERPTCRAYSISWGDGVVSNFSAQDACGKNPSIQASLAHTYTTRGKYTIELRDYNGDKKSSSSISIQ